MMNEVAIFDVNEISPTITRGWGVIACNLLQGQLVTSIITDSRGGGLEQAKDARACVLRHSRSLLLHRHKLVR